MGLKKYSARDIVDTYGREFFHLTSSEVAEQLGVTHTAVQNTERRAIEKLRKMFEERGITLKDLLED